jgi:DNA modification methylase
MSFILYNENCLNAMKRLEDNSVDSIVTDPPYGLSFMGKKWDYDVPSQEIWAECLRVLKPGGHLLAFAGTRTQHRMAVRIEDAGFEIRDMIAWVYGSGFPKSHDVSKAIDKAAGADREVVGMKPKTGGGRAAPSHDGWQRPWMQEEGAADKPFQLTAPATEAAKQWEGWGTALKPALEPITVARKPLIGTVAENVLEHGTGGLNIDGCRVGIEFGDKGGWRPNCYGKDYQYQNDGEFLADVANGSVGQRHEAGRWPANLIHDGSDEVMARFPMSGPPCGSAKKNNSGEGGVTWALKAKAGSNAAYVGDTGSTARFFYCAKSSKRDRDEGLEGFEDKQAAGLPMRSADGERGGEGLDGTKTDRLTVRKNVHPTVKPTDLMRYLCRLITPPNGVILDPFMGSGSTGKAAMLEGFQFIGCELSPEYMEIAKARIEAARVQGEEKPQQSDNLELF